MKVFKPVRLFLLLLTLPGLFSCQNANTSSGLTATLATNNTIYLLNAGDSSCASLASGTPTLDLSTASFNLGNITLGWTGSSNLTIAYIAISITGTNMAPFQQYVSSTEIPYVFSSASLNAGQIYLTAGSTISSSGCTLRFGGLQITNTNQSASGQGQVIVYGVPDDGSAPVSVISYFNVQFVPI